MTEVCAKIVDFGTCVALEAPMQRRFVDNPVLIVCAIFLLMV